MDDVGRFVALLECRGCRETVSVAGVRYTELTQGPEGEAEWDNEFHPKYFDLPPLYFAPPDNCAPEIVVELMNSFRLLLIDPSSAGSRLRTAVERLLDTQGVKSRARLPGRIVRLKLHERIEIFRRLRPELADALMAVKWLGNTGVHESALTRDDVFDGYDIVEHVLDELLTERTARVQKLAKAINRRRGPRRVKRPRRKKN